MKPSSGWNRHDALIQSGVFACLWLIVMSLQVYTLLTVKTLRIERRTEIEVMTRRNAEHDEHVKKSWEWLRNFVNEHTAKETVRQQAK
jgi:hypothetical protein